MKWERPVVRDFVSIRAHTFTAATAPPGKDTRVCTKDTHNEESCPTP
jgi:hypothetical protein